MSRAMRVALVVVVLTAAVWAPPAAGQETVELQLRLTRG